MNKQISLTIIAASILATHAAPAHAFFADVGPLLKLVAGQVQELQQLSESIGLAKDQMRMISQINEGIERTVYQIQTIQSIIERAGELDPREVRSLAELNDLLYRAKYTQAQLESIFDLKLRLTDSAIEGSSLQIDTTSRMGQEMVGTGSRLAEESRTASPGRAQQITASASSATMLSQGIELQTMAQMLQIQTMTLELQKTQLEKELRAERMQRSSLEGALKFEMKRPRSRRVARQ